MFYLLTVLVSWLEGDTGSDDSDFSPARKQADVYVSRKNWTSAGIEFEKLTKQDPLNAYAWHGFAKCIWERRTYAISKYKSLDSPDLRNSEDAQELEGEVDELNTQAIEALLHLKKFARYRPSALLQLAVIECDRGDYEEAMDFLEEFVGRGYQTSRGLDWIEQFGFVGDNEPPHPRMKFSDLGAASQFGFNFNFSQMNFRSGVGTRLHLEPRFWDLVERERESY